LKEVAQRAVQHAGPSCRERRRVPATLETFTGRFDANQFDAGLADERMEDTHCIRAATHAGDHGSGQTPFTFEDLVSGFPTDDRLEIADHARVGSRSND